MRSTRLDVITITEQLVTLPKAFKRLKHMEKSRDWGLGRKGVLITSYPVAEGGIPTLGLWGWLMHDTGHGQMRLAAAFISHIDSQPQRRTQLLLRATQARPQEQSEPSGAVGGGLCRI